MNEPYKLIQGDCMDILPTIPDKSVNLILCDLPYGTTAKEWDKLIPIEPLTEQYNRIITDNGVICLFGSEPFSTNLRVANIENYKYDLIWEKNTSAGFVHAKNRPLKRHENISVFSKGSMGHKSLLGARRMVYNPQGLIYKPKTHRGALKKFGGVVGKRPSQKDEFTSEWTNYPTSILKYAKTTGKSLTSTDKPIELLKYLINTFSNPGDIVLDNAMGSGSCGVAAIETGRHFIGIELMMDSFDYATKTIEAAIAANINLFNTQ